MWNSQVAKSLTSEIQPLKLPHNFFKIFEASECPTTLSAGEADEGESEERKRWRERKTR